MTEVLRQGTNEWVCMPGNEDVVGDPPMCVDALGMQWFKDLLEGKPQPTNIAPGLCYMLCGATQHSNTNAHDKTSPAIPIGPHWMILWPFDANHCGLPTTVRDAGAWIMFAGTPYAYLHVCGTPWAGNEYRPGDEAVWTMRCQKRASRRLRRSVLLALSSTFEHLRSRFDHVLDHSIGGEGRERFAHRALHRGDFVAKPL